MSRRDVLLVAPGGAKISHARMDDEAQPGVKNGAPTPPPRNEWVGVSVVFEGEREGTVICDIRTIWGTRVYKSPVLCNV